MTLYLGNKPVCPARVVEKKVAKTKFGASIDTFIGDVDENGVLNKTTWKGALDFTGVKEIGRYALQYAFYQNSRILSVRFSSLKIVRPYGLNGVFYSCSELVSADLSSLQTVEGRGMNDAFRNCYKLVSVNLSSLTDANDMYSLYNAFNSCSELVSVDLSSLQTVGQYALQYAFYGCKKLQKISFPSLTNVEPDSFGKASYNYAFSQCTVLTEIHFRADMQETIEALPGYADKWGATNATIYFNL